MKVLPFLLLATLFINTACKKNEVTFPKTSLCIESKIEVMRTANVAHTSITRYSRNGESFWLFDSGSAFDAPKYMLNVSCDTVCQWCRCSNIPVCHSDFDLGDSTAVVLWKY